MHSKSQSGRRSYSLSSACLESRQKWVEVNQAKIKGRWVGQGTTLSSSLATPQGVVKYRRGKHSNSGKESTKGNSRHSQTRYHQSTDRLIAGSRSDHGRTIAGSKGKSSLVAPRLGMSQGCPSLNHWSISVDNDETSKTEDNYCSQHSNAYPLIHYTKYATTPLLLFLQSTAYLDTGCLCHRPGGLLGLIRSMQSPFIHGRQSDCILVRPSETLIVFQLVACVRMSSLRYRRVHRWQSDPDRQMPW